VSRLTENPALYVEIVEALHSDAPLTAQQKADLDEHLQDLARKVAHLTEQFEAGVLHVCAWCQKEGRLVLLRPPILDHGICPKCLEKEEGALRAMEAQRQARAAQEDQEAEDRISPPIIEGD
jgi:hypothetical protein